jgi:tetratricopeptide (TPR) repeat protein
MSSAMIRTLKATCEYLLTFVSRIVSALMSNRSLAVLALVGCVVLITSPWLRPPITRDYRGPHIPIGELSAVSFLPEFAAQVPRPWRWDSVAVPLLAVAGIGVVVVLLRPRWTGSVFGLLLALGIPALAITLWNYPALIESFESDVRDRGLLRTMFRQHSEHMLSAGAPDRLARLGDKSTREDLLISRESPLLLPLEYSVYGGWLIGLALLATIVSQRGPWWRRFALAGAWTAVGLLLGLAATWPRLLAEHHFARANRFENANRIEQAEAALESVRHAMPSMAGTRRFWLTKGRLSVRQQQPDNRYASFYLAHQAQLSGDNTTARALLEPWIQDMEVTAVQRDLFAGIVAKCAAEYVADAKYSAAETCWGEASAVAPWKPAYQIAGAAAKLAAEPKRAETIDLQTAPLLKQFGDRMVVSDFHSLVGDAYFVTGNFPQARAMYSVAINLFHLPKYTNIPAQEGRLGL